MKDTPNVAGRTNEYRRIVNSFASKEIQAVVLYGPKYIGKTQILKSIVDEWSADSQLHTIYQDLAVLKSDVLDSGTVTDMLNQLAASVVSRLQVAGMKIGDISVRGDDIDFWKKLCQELPENQKVLLVLDSLSPQPVKSTAQEVNQSPFIADSFPVSSPQDISADSFETGSYTADSMETDSFDDEAAIFEALVQPVMELDPEKQAAIDSQEALESEDESQYAENDHDASESNLSITEQQFYTFLPQLLECEKLKLVIGADVEVPEQLTHYFSNYNHLVRTIQINRLSKDDTANVLHAENMEGLVDWSDKSAQERVWALTNGHPAFISAVSSAVSDDIFQDIGELERAKRIKSDMIDRALPRIVDNIEPVAGWYWESLSKTEQVILMVIAYMQSGVVSADTIALALNDIELSQLVWGVKDERFQVDVKLSQVNLSEILVKFQQLHLVELVGNVYTVPISLMREWIIENHEPPEDYVRLIRKASMQEVGYRPETATGGLTRYIPRPPQKAGQRTGGRRVTGRGVTVAVLIVLLVGALLSLPFLARTFGFEELTTYIPDWMLPSQSVLVADAASVSTEAESLSAQGTNTGAAVATGVELATPTATNAASPNQNDSESTTASVSISNMGQDEPSAEVEQNTTAPSSQDVGEDNPSVVEPASSQASAPQDVPETQHSEATFTLRQELMVDDMIWNLAFDKNEELLAAGLESGMVSIWEITEPDDPSLLLQLEGHTEEVLAVAFNPQIPTMLASGSADNSARIWNVETGETVYVLDAHSDEIGALAFHPNGETLATGSADKTIQLWNTATGELIATLGGENDWVLAVAFSPDGTQLASGTIDGTIQVWDVLNLTRLDTLEAHSDWVSSLAFSPVSGELASASYDESVYVWTLDERRFAPPTDAQAGIPTGTVNSVAFHPNGQYLIGGQHDGSLLVWNLTNPDRVSKLDGHLDAVRSAVFSPQGSLIATGALDGRIRLWQVDVE